MQNKTTLQEQALLNYDFAIRHHLPLDSFYSVSPHHSGIYPIVDDLYDIWSRVFLVKATSTDYYPENTVYRRRGFVHPSTGIMVLPRQTCGIWSIAHQDPNWVDHTRITPNVTRTIIYTPVNVFMTHWNNYANDRLAIRLFRDVFEKITKTTKIRLNSLQPLDTAQKYFEIFPQDRELIWTNICNQKKLLAISKFDSSLCENFPKFIIIGPQKTGKLIH